MKVVLFASALLAMAGNAIQVQQAPSWTSAELDWFATPYGDGVPGAHMLAQTGQ